MLEGAFVLLTRSFGHVSIYVNPLGQTYPTLCIGFGVDGAISYMTYGMDQEVNVMKWSMMMY